MTEIGLTTETIAKWHEIGVTAEEADAFGLKWLAVSIGVWLVGPGAAQGLGREVAARDGAARGRRRGRREAPGGMSARRLDGAGVAAAIRGELAARIAAFTAAAGRPPGLGIVLAGADPASEIYVRNKLRTAAEAGCRADLVRLAETASLADALTAVDRLNDDEAIDGILVQSPLPRGMGAGAEQRVFDAIRPDKDVDGFHPRNVGLLVQKRARLVACTPSGVIQLLERERIPIAGRHAVVIGRSDIVGKPMALLLLHRDATVTVCHSRTPDVAALTRQADLDRGRRRAPGVRHPGVRAPGRDGHRRRHQPHHRRRGGRGLLPRRPPAPPAVRRQGQPRPRRRPSRGRGGGRGADAGPWRCRPVDRGHAAAQHGGRRRRSGGAAGVSRMRRVALTGGIATGKSAVAATLRTQGVPVVDADALARKAVAAGSAGLREVVARFGSGVLAADGALDRAALGRIVFADPAARRDLERIVHPRVRAGVAAFFAGQDDYPAAIAEIPLAFETGWYRSFDVVVVVACRPAAQLERLMARDRLTLDQARARLAAQWPIEDKARLADRVIATDGPREDTVRQARATGRLAGA